MALVGVTSLAAFGCPGSGGGAFDAAVGGPPAPVTTTEPPNRPPVITVQDYATGVGERLDGRLRVTDPDGSVRRVAWRRPPPGFVRAGGALATSFTWTPAVAGTWTAEVSATDDEGDSTTATVTFVARHPARAHLLVALGDSVAAGFGLDLRDALLGDPCWRAPGRAYPSLVMDRLEDAGVVPQGRGQVVLVACAGTSTVDVWRAATWPPPEAPRDLDGAGVGWSQLDWAVQLNPEFVTVTVGANDMGVVDLSIAPGGVLDEAELQRRVDAVAGGVGFLLDELTQRTDATITLTTYYNPTAANPTGLGGCRGACFAELGDRVHRALNETLAAVAGNHDPQRVRSANLAPVFEGHEAGDALGPDWVREPIESLLGVQVRAYCSLEDPDDSWVSSLDCIHPTGDGMEAIAEVVAKAFSEDPPG